MMLPDMPGCWLWMSHCDAKGYGQTAHEGKSIKAHRLSYLLHRGPIPSGFHVLHSCDTRSCVNPAHLFVGTHQDNMRDMVSKGRQTRNHGALSGAAKLTETQVLAIRRDTRPQRLVAAEFGVSQSRVWAIRHRRSWARLAEENDA
jgi:hypothetical protein